MAGQGRFFRHVLVRIAYRSHATLFEAFASRTRNYAVLGVWLIGLASCGSNPKTYIERGNRFSHDVAREIGSRGGDQL